MVSLPSALANDLLGTQEDIYEVYESNLSKNDYLILWSDSIQKYTHHFAGKGQYSQSYDFSNSHVWMWVRP